MKDWMDILNFNPIEPLLNVKNEAIIYFTKRDLLEEKVGSIKTLWDIKEAKNILDKQQDNGGWKYPGKTKEEFRYQENYNQIETYRNIGILHEKYGLNKDHDSMKLAMNFLLSFQTDEGDIRGIYGTQYSPNYTAAIIEILLKMGFNNARIEKALSWLLSMRQEDGGWAFPIRTKKIKYTDAMNDLNAMLPDRTKPFSHLMTGMVLRAFAAHPKYRNDEKVNKAAYLLASNIFKREKYPDRQGTEYWIKFSFPFWFTDLLSALDSIYFIGINKDNEHVSEALNWLTKKQENDGTWNVKLLRTKDKDLKFWIGYVITRTFKRFYS